jgi:hypothetical protein
MFPNDLWLNGVPPAAVATEAKLKELGAFVAFEDLVCTWLASFLPLAPIFAQERPNICTYADHATMEQITTDAIQAVGMYIVVDLESAAKKSSCKQALVLSPFNFLVTITESPLLNRDVAAGGTGMSCKRVADMVALAFEGMPIGNGCASLKGVTFPSAGDGQQNAVVTFSTQLVVTLDHLLV